MPRRTQQESSVSRGADPLKLTGSAGVRFTTENKGDERNAFLGALGTRQRSVVRPGMRQNDSMFGIHLSAKRKTFPIDFHRSKFLEVMLDPFNRCISIKYMKNRELEIILDSRAEQI